MRQMMVWGMTIFVTCLLPAGEDWVTFFKKGKLLLDARYRLESVDQASRGDDALASTLRTRLGFETAPFHKWRVLLEFEDVSVIGNTRYNDTVNGETRYPVVADPEDTELNRVQLSFAGERYGDVVLGRQRLILGNSRYFGNVGWRQNEQTFDGLRWDYPHIQKTHLTLVYLANANRIFGAHHPRSSDIRLDAYLAQAEITGLPLGQVTLFGHFIDHEDQPGASHKNFGIRIKGAPRIRGNWRLAYDLSYTDQSSFRDGDASIDANYYSAALGPKSDVWELTVNIEVLGGDGVHGFATPFATLHAFNGWADQFLATPPDGLRDTFLAAAWGKKGWKLMLRAHRFEADEGGADYGEEWDALLTKKLGGHATLGLKLADYNAKTFSVDTTKIWAFFVFKW